MPGSHNDFQDAAIQAIKEELDKRINADAEKLIMGELWLPDSVEEKKAQREWKEKLYREWKEQATQVHDPVQKLRKDVMDELSDIKKAIRKLGVLLDGDAPTEEQLEKHKMLKEAYTKYKMIEKLVLGSEAREN